MNNKAQKEYREFMHDYVQEECNIKAYNLNQIISKLSYKVNPYYVLPNGWLSLKIKDLGVTVRTDTDYYYAKPFLFTRYKSGNQNDVHILGAGEPYLIERYSRTKSHNMSIEGAWAESLVETTELLRDTLLKDLEAKAKKLEQAAEDEKIENKRRKEEVEALFN